MKRPSAWIIVAKAEDKSLFLLLVADLSQWKTLSQQYGLRPMKQKGDHLTGGSGQDIFPMWVTGMIVSNPNLCICSSYFASYFALFVAPSRHIYVIKWLAALEKKHPVTIVSINAYRGFIGIMTGSGAGIRTPDTWIMIPLL